MRSAQYVGRVGALAVALGIGAVIAGVPGVAWAGPEGESDPSDAPGVSAPENPDGPAGDVSDTDVGGGDLGDPGDTGGVGDGGDVEGGGESAGGMQVGSSGGVITSTMPGSAGAKSEEKYRDADPPKKRAAVKQKVLSLAPSLTKTTTHSTEITVADAGRKARPQAPTLSVDPQKDPEPQVKQSARSMVDVAPLTLAAPGLQKQVPARMTAVTKPLAQSPALQLLPFVTLAPTADGKLPDSTESPLLLGFLAAGRQVDKKASIEDESIARTVDSTDTSLMMATTAPLASAQMKAAAPQTTRDTKPPAVSVTAPANVSGTAVTLSASATDNAGGSGVAGVQFMLDGENLGTEDTTPNPYSVSWNTTTVANGTHTLTAVARDAAGNYTTSAPVTVKVDNAAPAVSLTAPANVSGTAVTLSASATDNAGGSGVAGVQFMLDGENLGTEDTTPNPYSVSWNTTTVANGTHTLTAVARDAAGNYTTSAPVTVKVDNAAPAVSLTAPANVSGTAVTLSASATDNAGGSGVAGVQFMLDGENLGTEDTTPNPYSVSWNTTTVANGTHTLTAVARDAAGNTTTSTVNVTVDNETPTEVPFTVTSIPVNSYPTAVAFSGDYAFVYGGDVIWTIDTRTNRITDWVALYNEPPVVSGNRRYEAGYMSVSVIDNQTNAVIDTIDIPNCDSCGYGYSAGLQELALSPDGKRLYARHAYVLDYAVLSAVTVIDTSNNEVIGTTGPIFAKDIEIAVDGRVYAIDEDYYYADVDVYDKDMKYLNSIRLTSHAGSPWSAPTTFAISTDRKHAFAHVYDWESGGMTVSIIDTDPASPTYNAETYMTERYSAVSPDGTRLYVPELDGKTITVYDTATNAVVGSFITDEQPNTSFRGVYFAPNGTLYVADPGDNTLYAVTIGGTTVV